MLQNSEILDVTIIKWLKGCVCKIHYSIGLVSIPLGGWIGTDQYNSEFYILQTQLLIIL